MNLRTGGSIYIFWLKVFVERCGPSLLAIGLNDAAVVRLSLAHRDTSLIAVFRTQHRASSYSKSN